MYDIRGNYNGICKFLVFTQSIPPIDMGFRCNNLYSTTSIACFCPFGKDIRSIIKWFPEDDKPMYSNFFEVDCKKSRFVSYTAFLEHCDDSKNWHHEVYATFLRGFFCLLAKSSRKRKSLVSCNYNAR